MAANFKVKNHQDFDWIAQEFKPSNQLTDLGTEVRNAKSTSDFRHSLQIGYVKSPNVRTYLVATHGTYGMYVIYMYLVYIAQKPWVFHGLCSQFIRQIADW